MLLKIQTFTIAVLNEFKHIVRLEPAHISTWSRNPSQKALLLQVLQAQQLSMRLDIDSPGPMSLRCVQNQTNNDAILITGPEDTHLSTEYVIEATTTSAGNTTMADSTQYEGRGRAIYLLRKRGDKEQSQIGLGLGFYQTSELP
uniref:Uncharacterized protein n=1 Tax=Physcomitrium patens TaxID=3218 RepID=A0A2K1JHA6_PHYPA|nr:hypothetical protein PHYPA_018343 [Physcomitrium patens]